MVSLKYAIVFSNSSIASTNSFTQVNLGMSQTVPSGVDTVVNFDNVNINNNGWFDTTKIKKPSYDEHLKFIQRGVEQFEFIFSSANNWKIEDLMGVFDYEQLNLFEQEFLEFSKEHGTSKIFVETDNIDTTYTSFREILKEIFIIDNNNQFLVEEISKAQSIKLQDTISKFLDISVYLKNGNPKKYDRKHFGHFISNTTGTASLMKPNPDSYDYGVYVKNSLPTSGGTTTLAASQTGNSAAWKALDLYIGPSSINGIKYTDNGSYITDFFVDNNIAFTENNVKVLSKLIKIYATQKKLKNGNYNSTQFSNDITTLTQNVYNKRTNIENSLRAKLPNSLNVGDVTNTAIVSSVDGDNTKLEIWELFKAINDKWVAGINFSNPGPDKKVLFEEFLFFDRSNRDIGDSYVVNVDTIRKYCTWDNSNTSVMSLIRQILADNRMNFFVMPAYINFYGRPTVGSGSRTETILNNANDTFSAFGYVDTLTSGPKFLCQYIGRPSETLSMDNDPKYPFKSDSFDMGVTAGNPLRNTSTPSQDKQFQNNKAVGFVVDFGTANQSVFKSVEIAQNQNVTSSEQIQTVVDMGRLGGNKKTSQQTTALYELYKNRTYDCTLKTFGNVMLQPTMYFVVRHMPMFNGTYIIRSVKHSISPGAFNTEVRGQRLSALSNLSITSELAAVNQDFNKKLSDKVKTLTSNNSIVTLNSASNQYLTGQQSKDYQISGRTPYQGFISTAVDSKEQTCQVNLWGAQNEPISSQATLTGEINMSTLKFFASNHIILI